MSDIVYNMLPERSKRGHDMSASTVKLDYGTLTGTVMWAVRLLGDEIDRERGAVRDALDEHSYHSMIGAESHARYLREYATALDGAMDTLHALLAIQEREVVEIVNRPEIK